MYRPKAPKIQAIVCFSLNFKNYFRPAFLEHLQVIVPVTNIAAENRLKALQFAMKLLVNLSRNLLPGLCVSIYQSLSPSRNLRWFNM